MNRAAFTTRGEPDPELSMHLAKLLSSAEDCLETRPHFGVGVITVADVTNLGFVVQHDPQPDDYSHVLVIGINNTQTARALAKRTRLLIRPKTA